MKNCSCRNIHLRCLFLYIRKGVYILLYPNVQKAEGGLHSSKKKTSVVSSSDKQREDNCTYNAAGAVVCTICSNAKTKSEFSMGKKWDEWKLNYQKQHLSQKVHITSVVKLQNTKYGGILGKLQESVKDSSVRLETKYGKNAD